jgi:hypothetical protein
MADAPVSQRNEAAMNRRTWLLVIACAIALYPSLQAQTDTSLSGSKQTKNAAKARKGTVRNLAGTKFSGFVEITDDYTIRITNNSGIARLPIAQLSDADFQKYGFRKDRSKDGRFWYERKEALKSDGEDSKPQKNAKADRKSVAEIRLAEISAFQPLIAAYEETLVITNSEKGTAISEPGEKPETYDAPFRPMFSEPSLRGPLTQGLPSLGRSAVPSAPGAARVPFQ